jgi:hypothetical protein
MSQLTGQSTALTDKGLQFAGNGMNTVTNKLGSKVTVKGGGTKDDTSYSDSNLKTVVSQGTNGDTIIDVMMDKDITADSIKVGKDGQDGVSITGPGGLNGKDGKVGISGKDGKDAVSISGQNGVGHIGLTGPKGADGSDGVSADISVKDGAAGVNGKDGETMTRVVYEDKDGTTHTVATLDDGMKYSGDSGTQLKMNLNENVNIKGGVRDATKLSDNNIGVVADGTTDTLTVKLAKNLTGLESMLPLVLAAAQQLRPCLSVRAA